MALYIYNTLARKKQEFEPLKPGYVGMYVCGPTVYDIPHLGHARSAYIFEVIRRYLIYKGYKVKFVRNVTDIDDKIIERSNKEYPDEQPNKAIRLVSDKYLKAYHRDMEALGISAPDVEPKATQYIDKMISFIDGLIKKDVAYISGGNVYFDIHKAKGYGKLSNQSLEKISAGARVQPGEEKKNPMDFALWKESKEGEPFWDSPWSKGRPGWHIECSVMSLDILGDEFDIHGGGIDLIFPHHENEIAQSEGAGKRFARIWIHNGLLTINGEKMAKSLGNFITLEDFLKRYKNPDFLKLIFLGAHYRHPVDYTDQKVKEAQKALERIKILFQKISEIKRQAKSLDTFISDEQRRAVDRFKEGFDGFMNDDFNTASALSVLFNLVTYVNTLIDQRQIHNPALYIYVEEVLVKLVGIFGLSFRDLTETHLEQWVLSAISRRENLRRHKRFNEADAIREELRKKGIILEDTKDGTRWRRVG